HLGEARAALDEANKMMTRNQEFFYQAELLRLRGELRRREHGAPEERHAEVEALLREALVVARRQGARAWELRAATTLVDFLSSGAGAAVARSAEGDLQRQEAWSALSILDGSFVEGAETADR